MTPEADDAGSDGTGPGGADEAPARLGRFEALDKRPVNLDGFAERDDEAGLVAFASANDPEPSVALDEDGRVTELDGHAAEDFDLIDAFIAARGIDAEVAVRANGLDDVAFARLIVDPGTPRAQVVHLAAGATPEKLARVVALLRPVELQMAVSKMRVRRTPSNQAHVTNRLDDPAAARRRRGHRSRLRLPRGRDHRPRQRRRAVERPRCAHRLRSSAPPAR